MYIWYNARSIRNNQLQFTKIAPYYKIISDIKKDESISKYTTNLVYLTKANYDDEIESKIMEIGVPTDSYFKFAPITIERPILVYGTSIAQGASASRPAMAWTNILQRRFDMPVINLGFSGNALMDPAVYDLISEVDARMGLFQFLKNDDILA